MRLRSFDGFDRLLLTTVLCLLSIGIVSVYAASRTRALEELNDPLYFVQQQVAWVLIGIVVMLILGRMPEEITFRMVPPLFVVALVLLWVTLIPGVGTAAGGAVRWLRFGGFAGIQPSELAKLALVLYLALWLDRRRGQLIRTAPWFTVIVALIAVPVIAEPDLGAVIVMLAISLAMLYVAGAPLGLFALWAAAAGIVLTAAALLRPERIARVLDSLSILSDRPGSPHLQIRYALRAGGLVGTGLNNPPEVSGVFSAAYTDSIYVVIAGTLGLIGALLIVLLYLAFIFAGLRIAIRATTIRSTLAATGITAWIAFQAWVNLAVEVGIAPPTGVPLPFVSYGGSSLVIGLAAVGVLLSVSREASLRDRPSVRVR